MNTLEIIRQPESITKYEVLWNQLQEQWHVGNRSFVSVNMLRLSKYKLLNLLRAALLASLAELRPTRPSEHLKALLEILDCFKADL